MNPPAVQFSLHRSADEKLIFTEANGTVHQNVRPVRLFPLTDPTRWISLCSSDGHELIRIDDPSSLPESVRTTLIEAIAERDFVPVIQSIQAIRCVAHGYEWKVTTDRGKTVFCMEDDESIQYLGGGSIVIVDRHNMRYLIPDPDALDPKSRQKLERYY